MTIIGSDHVFKIITLQSRVAWGGEAGAEADAEILRYRDEGLEIQAQKEIGMDKSGFCAFESAGSHALCKGCSCQCHAEQKAFSGRGILFAVIDDREAMRYGTTTTVEVIAEAIEAALDAGQEDSEQIARYLTTSAFSHIPDKRVRFNSVLKAGDSVGANLVKKLHTAYNELCDLAAEPKRAAASRAQLEAEARGFAEAMQIILSPFSVEDADDRNLVNWDEVDKMTELFAKEQSSIRAAVKKEKTRK